MKQFSKQSADRLATCHPDLQRLFTAVLQLFDCTVLEGHRGQQAQDLAFASGQSKVKWPEGKHNKLPSLAVDVTPYPIDFNDINRIYYFAGHVMGMASMMGIKIRYGGDWNHNTEVKDESFKDLVHFELE